ncbi:MAG: response regulator [Firmicutes bacterium]|nr:response regulator [Bacillota bacterium]
MLGPVCVVIAEDNFVLRRVVVDYLATFGIVSIEAGTEAEAWSALVTRQVDVLVLDMVLSNPRLVLPLLQRIQKEPNMRGIPVIITTAFKIDSLRSSEGGDCLTDYSILQKPYDLCQLRRTIVQASDKHRKPVTPYVS